MVSAEEITSLSETYRAYIPIGSVEFCTELLKHFGKQVPPHISYPQSLYPFLKRKLTVSTFKDVDNGIFIKPFAGIKSFTGHIKGKNLESLPENIDEQLVYSSSIINLIGEWRYYVLAKQVLGFSRYDGDDNDVIPDISVITDAIDSFENPPIGYSIDIGVLDTGETVLIEVNDGWALGYYTWGNMTEQNYLKLITHRWKEIMNC
jgi:hypothetical protein